MAGIGPPAGTMTPVKVPVEKCASLDVRELDKAGYFAPGPGQRRLDLTRGDRYIATLTLAMGEDRFSLEGQVFPGPGIITPVRTIIHLVRTPAINQTERLWFSCPVCEKRVGKLYLPPGRTMFLCRHCHDLTYQRRQKEPSIWRRMREEEPELRKELQNTRLGLARRARAARKLEKLWAELERASLKTERLAPPGLIDIFEEFGMWRRREPRPQPSVPSSPPPPPAPEPAPILERRSRGRPKKEKRPYERQKPFHESERRTQAEVFCVKCRAYREPLGWTLVTFKNGRPALQGVCRVCGSKMARIISARLAELLASIPAKPAQDAAFFD